MCNFFVSVDISLELMQVRIFDLGFVFQKLVLFKANLDAVKDFIACFYSNDRKFPLRYTRYIMDAYTGHFELEYSLV